MAAPPDLHIAAWPVARLGEALEALARKSGLLSVSVHRETQATQPPLMTKSQLDRWIDASAASLGFEAEAVTALYPDVESLIRGAGPALLRLPGERDLQAGDLQEGDPKESGPQKGEPLESDLHFLVVLGCNRKTITVLDPTLHPRRLAVSQVRDALCRPWEAPLAAETDRLLDEVGVSPRRRQQARKTILAERLSAAHIEAGWLLRPQPGRNLGWQIQQARLPQRLLIFVGTYTLQYFIWLLAWWVIGRGGIAGPA